MWLIALLRLYLWQGERYYTFEVHIPRSSTLDRSKRIRRVGAALMLATVAVSCLAALTWHSQAQGVVSASMKWAAQSIVHNTDLLAVWKQSRPTFLASLPKEFPEVAFPRPCQAWCAMLVADISFLLPSL